MTQVYVLALVGALVAVALIIELLRRRQLTEKYAVIWLVLGVSIVVLALWPRLLEAASEAVGIAVPSNLLFFGAAFVLLFVCLQLSREASRLEEETRTLAEDLALLRQEVAELKNEP
jgi:hypothetical protein